MIGISKGIIGRTLINGEPVLYKITFTDTGEAPAAIGISNDVLDCTMLIPVPDLPDILAAVDEVLNAADQHK